MLEFLDRSEEARLPVLLGGGLGLSAYMPLRRRTKDLDFYVHPRDRDRTVAMLAEMGFHDFYDEKPYDRDWIYRSRRGEVIIDIIWRFANYFAEVDDEWFTRCWRFPAGERVIPVVPPEELIRAKIFVFQRERCDWPDLLNLLNHCAAKLDFTYLRKRLGSHSALLESLLTLYGWLCPNGADPPKDELPSRPNLLDTRPWFLAKP